MAWLTGWSYRKKLTVDHSKVDSDCSDFPVKTIFDGDNFAFAHALETGNDVRFTSSDGETLLKHERELHQVGDTPTGYANASYETEFDGVDDYYSLPSASNLHKPYQVLEVEFTANAVNKDQNIVYLEMADRTGATWFSLVKERSVRLGITSEGKLIGYMECSNTGTYANASVTSSASLSADTKYSAKLVIDNNTKSLELYLDGQLQGSNTVTHAQTWSDISAYIWCDLGVLFGYHSTTSTNHSRYFDGTIHSYNLMAQNTLTSAVYHVKIPTASSTSDTEFYCYYGKSDATDGADGENVWDSNYAMVHHMGSSLLDSTSNDNDGTNSGSTLGLARDGYFRSFDGSNDYIDLTGLTIANTNDLSFEIMAQHGESAHLFDAQTGRWVIGWNLTDNLGVYYNSWFQVTTDIPADGGMHLVGVTLDQGTERKIYIDDNSPDAAGSGPTVAIGGDVIMGARYALNSAFYNGKMSEYRISTTLRSDAWIKATSASLHDELLTFGSEESAAPPIQGVHQGVQIIFI